MSHRLAPDVAADTARTQGSVLTALRWLWARWKTVGRRLAQVQAQALLTLCYFVVVPPFALLVRWTADPLRIKPRTPRGWQDSLGSSKAGLVRAGRQY